MSRFHQYPEFSDSVIQRWQKVVTHAIAGTRLDPHNPQLRVSFILESDEKAFDLNSKTLIFDYDTDVLELYTEQEKRMFTALNKPLIAQGMIAPYEDAPQQVDMSNVFTDAQLQEILTLKRADFLARVNDITSWATIGRMIGMLRPNDPQWKRTTLEDKQRSLIS